MLNEVKPNLDLLMSIRLGLAEQYGIPLDVPFRDYKAWYRWTGMEVPTQTMRADFVNQLYSKEGKPCRFEDIFEFERLSKAWLFDENGLQEWDVDEPRLKKAGVWVEGSESNIFQNSLIVPPESKYRIRSNIKITDSGVSKVTPKKEAWLYNTTVRASVSHQDNYGVHVRAYTRSKEPRLTLIGHNTLITGGNATTKDFCIYGTRMGMSDGATRELTTGVRYEANHDECVVIINSRLVEDGFDSTANSSNIPPSPIISGDSTTTRLKDSLSTTIPQGHTITGDWDDTLHLFERDGQLDFEGYGYIRTLEMIPMEGSYTADFTKDTIISHTGFEHRGIFGRGIFEFERLSKAWDFIDGELKEYEVGEARFSEKGMLVEPESTNYLRHNINLTTGAWSSGNKLATLTPVGYGMFKVSPDGRLVHFSVVSEIDGEEATASCYIADASTPITMSSRRLTGDVYVGGIVSDGDITPYGFSTHSVHRKGVQFGYSKTTSSTGAGYASWQLQQTTEPYVASCPQWELGLQMTSGILTDTTPVTRLPETITHPTTLEFLSIDKDEGILHEDGVFSGFGYIRKIEVKV